MWAVSPAPGGPVGFADEPTVVESGVMAICG